MRFKKDLPQAANAMVERDGKPSQAWWRFFSKQFSAASPQRSVTVTASPFLYGFTENGFVIVEGGTVSLIELLRGPSVVTTYDLGATAGQFAVRNGDAIQITYTVAPTVTFFPD